MNYHEFFFVFYFGWEKHGKLSGGPGDRQLKIDQGLQCHTITQGQEEKRPKTIVVGKENIKIEKRLSKKSRTMPDNLPFSLKHIWLLNIDETKHMFWGDQGQKERI